MDLYKNMLLFNFRDCHLFFWCRFEHRLIHASSINLKMVCVEIIMKSLDKFFAL